MEICWQKSNKKLSNIVNVFVEVLTSKLSFACKVGDLFSDKEAVPKYLRYFVFYRWTCSGCNASYIGETIRHLTTRIKEYSETGPKCHFFTHLSTSRNCNKLCDTECFEIIGSSTSSYRLKLKKAMNITYEKPSLNKQVKHVSISINI